MTSKQLANGREKPPVPEIAVTEEDSMGDIDMARTNVDEPFAQYKHEDDQNNDENTIDDLDLNELADGLRKAEGLRGMRAHLKVDGAPGSRKVSKVSFQSDPNSNPSSRKVSAHGHGEMDGMHAPPMPYLHPVYSGIPLAPNFRKLSSQPFGYYYDTTPTNSRKSSMEVFGMPGHHAAGRLPYGHGKVSVFSIGNASDSGYLESDESERVPDLEHYRVSVFDNQRPTLFQLREDAKVKYTRQGC